MKIEDKKIKIEEEIKLGAGEKKQTSDKQFSWGPQSASDVIEHTTETPEKRKWEDPGDDALEEEIDRQSGDKITQFGEINIEDILEELRINMDFEELHPASSEQDVFVISPDYYSSLGIVWDESDDNTCYVTHDEDKKIPEDRDSTYNFLLSLFVYYLENHKNKIIRDYFEKNKNDISITPNFHRVDNQTKEIIASEVPVMEVTDEGEKIKTVSLAGDFVVGSKAIYGTFCIWGERIKKVENIRDMFSAQGIRWGKLTIVEVETPILEKVVSVDSSGELVYKRIPNAKDAWGSIYNTIENNFNKIFEQLGETIEICEMKNEEDTEVVEEIAGGVKHVRRIITDIDTICNTLYGITYNKIYKDMIVKLKRRTLVFLTKRLSEIVYNRGFNKIESLSSTSVIKTYKSNEKEFMHLVKSEREKNTAIKQLKDVEEKSKLFLDKFKEICDIMGEFITSLCPNSENYGLELTNLIRESVGGKHTRKVRMTQDIEYNDVRRGEYNSPYNRRNKIDSIRELGKAYENLAHSDLLYNILIDNPSMVRAFSIDNLRKLTVRHIKDIVEKDISVYKYFLPIINRYRQRDKYFDKIHKKYKEYKEKKGT